ncbi:MAG: MFS transporter, partial [Acidimicrobiales bacterium]
MPRRVDIGTGGLRRAEVRAAGGRPAWTALAPLLLGTFIGTLSNNIVNVPMSAIMAGLHVNLAKGALVVITFALTFAVLMPITGWLGDRIGRRRLFCGAVAVLGLGSAGASLAPSLSALVACRVVQGAGTAAILPTVMALITDIVGVQRRG